MNISISDDNLCIITEQRKCEVDIQACFKVQIYFDLHLM